MEGPSLVIAREEFTRFLRKQIQTASGSAQLPYDQLTGSRLIEVRNWGKHLVLRFSRLTLRVHFLMFGSYRIDDPRAQRTPKLHLKYAAHDIYFYSCAVKIIPADFEGTYDWSIDLMSPQWSARNAAAHVRALPKSEIGDILMDQTIFAGLGNIMKNEILFNLKMHPQTKIANLTPARVRTLVREAETYAWKFYEWKKANVLKRNWKIMRKKTCPRCGGRVTKRPTGALERLSHYCKKCQVKA